MYKKPGNSVRGLNKLHVARLDGRLNLRNALLFVVSFVDIEEKQ